MLADNKIGKNSIWDDDKLKLELEMLLLDDEEFSIGDLGFSTPGLDLILDDGRAVAPDPVDDWDDEQAEAVAKRGDCWQAGEHRIFCGDSRDPTSYAELLQGELADQVITDPPYNVKIARVVGLGRTKHKDFAEASGEMSQGQFQSFLDITLGHAKAHCRDGAIVMAFMDWRHIQQLLQTGENLTLELKNLCVWVKDNGGMGSLYRSQHELIAIFKNGTAPHQNNVELGRHGRYRTNVWQYAGVNSFRRGRAEDLATHPTVKPLALVADAIKDCSPHSGLILDIFGGSGTTLLAAERTGRRARLIEIDPHYVDATIRRWEKMTGRKAELLRSANVGAA